MVARDSGEAAHRSTKGNHISEWFGQRIFPKVHLDVSAVVGKNSGSCPFLTNILKNSAACVKGANSAGVCSVSSASNGVRQDWLVCPYRVIDSSIVSRSCSVIFGLEGEVQPTPVSILKSAKELEKFKARVKQEGAGYLFFQDKLGGEISVIGTERSPEMAFDVTLVEIRHANGGFEVSRYGILEIQTMDFHGSYKHAVSNLRDALRLHPNDFPSQLQATPHWAGERVEGPNIANVFKRTFYQIMLKFKLAGSGAAAGTVLALPRSVWESWQPFLGAPDIEVEKQGFSRFKLADGDEPHSFICVFDLDSDSDASISPLSIDQFIRVSSEQLAHHALSEVPRYMLQAIQSHDAVLSRIKTRMIEWWPEISSGEGKVRAVRGKRA